MEDGYEACISILGLEIAEECLLKGCHRSTGLLEKP